MEPEEQRNETFCISFWCSRDFWDFFFFLYAKKKKVAFEGGKNPKDKLQMIQMCKMLIFFFFRPFSSLIFLWNDYLQVTIFFNETFPFFLLCFCSMLFLFFFSFFPITSFFFFPFFYVFPILVDNVFTYLWYIWKHI